MYMFSFHLSLVGEVKTVVSIASSIFVCFFNFSGSCIGVFAFTWGCSSGLKA